MPCQLAAGCGGFQRSAPTGGAANGMPLNAVTPATLPDAPVIKPLSMPTGSATAMAHHRPAQANSIGCSFISLGADFSVACGVDSRAGTSELPYWLRVDPA